jgi:hypothetical protein
MKHIKKKTVNEFKLPDEFPALEKNLLLNNANMPKLSKDYHALLITNDRQAFRAFFYKYKQKNCFIPLAHPVLVYYNKAYNSYRSIQKIKEDLIEKLHGTEILNENLLKLIYDLFGETSSYVTILYSSLEAFINQYIPDNFHVEISENDKYTRKYNNMQIQRWLTFEQKIKLCLNKESGKDFEKKNKNQFQFIKDLKVFRDSIIHTKKIDTFGEYEKLYKLSLDYKYEETLIACKDFINFYEPDLIEECPCKLTF